MEINMVPNVAHALMDHLKEGKTDDNLSGYIACECWGLRNIRLGKNSVYFSVSAKHLTGTVLIEYNSTRDACNVSFFNRKDRMFKTIYCVYLHELTRIIDNEIERK